MSVSAVDPTPGTGAVPAEALLPIVSLRGVNRRYPGGRGVGPFDLEIRAGEVLALMGVNGAGKSTLLRIVATADRSDAGQVTWWGCADRRRARRRIGYAPDEPAEEVSLSVRQATHFWCSQWVRDRSAARRLTGAALDGLGLGDRADEPVGTLSYGLRRRLALAQALAPRPPLALLDEPSAGLDPAGCGVVAGFLRSRAAAGATTVVASNDPELVAAVADRVAILHLGRCVRLAPLDALLGEIPRRRVVELRLQGPAADQSPLATKVAGLLGAQGLGAVTARISLVPGVQVLRSDPGVLRVELADDASLARLVAAADADGAEVRSLEVRRPDLRDCFPALAEAARAELDR